MKNINTMSGREKQDKKVGGNNSSGNAKINAVKESVKNKVKKIHEK